MAERVGIYYHRTAREEKIRDALALADSLGSTGKVEEVQFPLPVIPDALNTVVAVGGDGTLRSVAEKMLERDDPGTLVAVDGGTNNAYYGSLLHEGSRIQAEDVPEAHQMDIRPFFPGQVNEQHVFLYMAEHGRVVEGFGTLNERMRNLLPRDSRTYVAAFASGLWEVAKRTEEPLVRAFFTAGEFHGSPLSLDHSLYDDTLLMATIPAMRAAEFLMTGIQTVRSMREHVPFPEELFTIQRAEAFTLPTRTRKIGLGGDIVNLRARSLYVSRMDKSIKATALEIPTSRRTRS